MCAKLSHSEARGNETIKWRIQICPSLKRTDFNLNRQGPQRVEIIMRVVTARLEVLNLGTFCERCLSGLHTGMVILLKFPFFLSFYPVKIGVFLIPSNKPATYAELYPFYPDHSATHRRLNEEFSSMA